ncbi:Uncharacterized protein Fot_13370 [Forsythia ovata]|uniref:Uncharacterized protein n=1 Tax=Forsythia ovata TaxID=205694 RepID=A0ABD1W3A6_9LAMI
MAAVEEIGAAVENRWLLLMASKTSIGLTYAGMAPIFDLVRDIDTTKTSWAIKVRIVRVYEQMRYTNPNEVYSLDFVSHDKEITSQRISLLSSSTVYTVSCDLESGNTEFRTIDELISGGEVSSSSDEVTTPIKKSTTIDHSGDMCEGSVTKRSLAGELSSNVAKKKLKSVIKQENE